MKGGHVADWSLVCKSVSMLAFSISSQILVISFFKKKLVSWQMFSPGYLGGYWQSETQFWCQHQQVCQQIRSLLIWQYIKQLLYLLQQKHRDQALSVIYTIFSLHDVCHDEQCGHPDCTKACEILHSEIALIKT